MEPKIYKKGFLQRTVDPPCAPNFIQPNAREKGDVKGIVISSFGVRFCRDGIDHFSF